MKTKQDVLELINERRKKLQDREIQAIADRISKYYHLTKEAKRLSREYTQSIKERYKKLESALNLSNHSVIFELGRLMGTHETINLIYKKIKEG